MAIMMTTMTISSHMIAMTRAPAAAGQRAPHDSIDHVVLLKSRSVFTNILKGRPPSPLSAGQNPMYFHFHCTCLTAFQVPFCVLHLVALSLALREWMALPPLPPLLSNNDR
jgi:hypothetical protein